MLQFLQVLVLGKEEHLIVDVKRSVACSYRSRGIVLDFRAIMSICYFFHLSNSLSRWHSNLILLGSTVMVQVKDGIDLARLNVTRRHRLVVKRL